MIVRVETRFGEAKPLVGVNAYAHPGGDTFSIRVTVSGCRLVIVIVNETVSPGLTAMCGEPITMLRGLGV